MAGQGKIGMAEAISLCIVFIVTKIFLSFQVPIIDTANNAGWLAVLAASLIGVLGYLIIEAVLKRYPGKNIVEIGEELVGPVFNSFFSLGYLLFFIFLVAMGLRQFSERVITSFVEEMPISFAVFSFMAGVIIVSYLGLEAITRTSRLFSPILLVMFVLLIIASFPYWRMQYIYPLLGGGIAAIGKTAVTKGGMMAEIFILAVVNQSLPEKRLRAIGTWSLAVSGFIFIITVLTTQMVFPYPVNAELSLPTFELAKIIYLGRFFQRLETAFMPIWAMSGLISLTIGIYAASFIAAAMLKIPYYRPLILPLSVIAIAVSFIPDNIAQAVIWDNNILRNYAWTVTIIPPLIYLLLGRLKGKKGENGGGKKAV